MQIEHILTFSIMSLFDNGFFLWAKKTNCIGKISIPLVKFGIPISVMGLLLKNGVDINLLKSA